ncbi:GerAB/ArcD/ProY family transporter [Paenibacillus sp. y28]|uniref:GerAB/ArcD/ProY family transporter n=1 Tax=Paenibacillus sp. y28 TaxID=3129110 RepID=UPI0030166248
MSSRTDRQITFMQHMLFNSGIQISVVFLSLPSVVAERAGTDGWIAIIIGWSLSAAASLAVVRLMSKQPDGTVLDLITRVLGKWMGKAFAVILALYFLVFGYWGITKAILITKIWVLSQTPAYLIMMLFLIPSYMVMRHGPAILARYAEIIIFLSLWIPFAYLIPIRDAHWLHLLPVLKEGWMPILAASQSTIYSYVGFGTTLFIYPSLKDKHRAAWGLFLSNTLTLVVYLLITIACFVYFSPDEITSYHEPVIPLLKAIEFRFVERIEVIFIAYYLLLFSMGWIPVFYVTVYCTTWLLGGKDHRFHLRILCVALAAGSYFFMPSFYLNEQMDSLVALCGIGIEYILPILLLMYIWLAARLRRRTAE